jgi:flagellar L-ring protein precursor FlgH
MRAATILWATLAGAGAAWGQSLLEQGGSQAAGASPYDPPRRLPFKKHDHVQIVVQERSRALSSAELRTDRRSRWEVELEDFIRFHKTDRGATPRLRPAELAGDPGIDLDARFRQDNSGRTTRQFDLTFTIMAEVIDVRPNGTLVVQAIKRRKVNADEETIKLTGEVAPTSVVGDKVPSDRVVNLAISYEGSGSVSDNANPGILGWVLGKLWPF